VWTDLREQIAVEQAQLQKLLEIHRPLLDECRSREPNPIELSALGAFLHSGYTGVENLFQRITVELGGRPPQGHAWHQRLLRQMAEPDKNRPAVISEDLQERLKPYLQFRHVFRQAYAFQLHWEKMAPLVLGYEEVLEQLWAELDRFLEHPSPS
jgi:hypothetical protein